ncbi:hypothetical protein M438DRAFT_78290 [Aureobasidium pullulans EXF-150]|uniref:Uncharacterized protein n=1 Tax=Aureobasidium pullulans EXF-150 TaxID=1043002 RepID=A0A074X7F5_AURPU|nr:uncharacterized protein M438DRAFT_78290 [Aureobasidium pullulans EXF-150]KEQ81318.1 hypothetical protein M438DRAFT_78290 [Aureobasidium pullulans EXF-150]
MMWTSVSVEAFSTFLSEKGSPWNSRDRVCLPRQWTKQTSLKLLDASLPRTRSNHRQHLRRYPGCRRCSCHC